MVRAPSCGKTYQLLYVSLHNQEFTTIHSSFKKKIVTSFLVRKIYDGTIVTRTRYDTTLAENLILVIMETFLVFKMHCVAPSIVLRINGQNFLVTKYNRPLHFKRAQQQMTNREFFTLLILKASVLPLRHERA